MHLDHDLPRTDALPSGACIPPPCRPEHDVAAGAPRFDAPTALARRFNIPLQLAGRIDAKRFATAQARAMWFYGIRLDAIEDDDGAPAYVATLHALTRTFRTLAEVEGWLHAIDQTEAPRGEVARFIGAQEVAA